KQEQRTVILAAEIRPIIRSGRTARSYKRIVMRRHHASNGERCFEMLGRTKVGFAPTGRIPSFEGWHRDLFCGSVAGRLKTPSLLIRRKNIAVRIYHKWYGSTVRRCAASL